MKTVLDVYRSYCGLSGTPEKELQERLDFEARQYLAYGDACTSVFARRPEAYDAYKRNDPRAMADSWGVRFVEKPTAAQVPSERDEIDSLLLRVASIEEDIKALYAKVNGES